MKLLLDFLPVILFFGTFKYAEANKDWAATFATEHFGFMVHGGIVSPEVAPVLLATLVVIAATLVQVGIMLARGKKIDTMTWVSLALVVVLGGATIWFHSETFIKWKLTAVYWIMALSFWGASTFFGKNLLKALIGAQISLPEFVWRNLNLMWIAFFTFMGALNLYVAFNYSTDTWVNFKLFGGLGLMLVFMVAQGLYLNKHAHAQPQPTQPGKPGA